MPARRTVVLYEKYIQSFLLQSKQLFLKYANKNDLAIRLLLENE